MDYKYNALYFFPTPAKVVDPKKPGFFPFVAIIIGIIIMTAERDAGARAILIGLVPVMMSIAWITYIVCINARNANKAAIFNRNRTIVSDSQIDKICKDYLEDKLEQMAYMKLVIDRDQVNKVRKIRFDGYDFKDLNGGKPDIKLGSDGKFRSSHYSGTLFLFSAEQVFYYQLRFSLIKDEKQETTREFHYRDIVDISTVSSKCHFNEGLDTISIPYEEFSLVTAGGTIMEASLSGLDKENTDSAIKGMRSMLRDRKQKR